MTTTSGRGGLQRMDWRRGLAALATGALLAGQALAGSNSFKVPHTFVRSVDGLMPSAGLVKGGDGRLYGTTFQGGSGDGGTVFAYDPAKGTTTVLHNFANDSAAAGGSAPQTDVLWGADGKLYGVTSTGGAYSCGVAYQLDPVSLAYKVVHTFIGGSTEGCGTAGSLVQGSDGSLYGVTLMSGKYDEGTLYRLTTAGVLTVLHFFSGQDLGAAGVDGSAPFAGVTLTPQGDIYGVTMNGGHYGGGVAYRVTAQGAYTTLHDFGANGTDSRYPIAPLLLAKDGNFYGTTEAGGDFGGGTAFRMTPAGALTTLHQFGDTGDGVGPYTGGLIELADGNFYGTTAYGGASGWGTVYQLSAKGTLTLLHSFALDAQGSSPLGRLAKVKSRLYGVTFSGYNSPVDGTIFSLRKP